MTDEIIDQGIKLRDRIREIDEVLYSITPYMHNDVEITVQKKVFDFNGEKLYYRLKYNSPLWKAIESSLKDIRSDLQKQFEELGCNSEKKEPVQEPIRKTNPWWKFWRKK